MQSEWPKKGQATMSDTPRTDAMWKSLGHAMDSSDALIVCEISRTLERELEQEKKWKAEDPRMLREQIRVADVAFNGLNERHNAALVELARLKAKLGTWDDCEAQSQTIDRLQAQLAECQAARAG